MSEQYYVLSHYEMNDPKPWEVSNAVPVYKPVDIGWRWCENELPSEDGDYLAINQCGYLQLAIFNCGNFNANIVQWCKLPEPLTKENNER